MIVRDQLRRISEDMSDMKQSNREIRDILKEMCIHSERNSQRYNNLVWRQLKSRLGKIDDSVVILNVAVAATFVSLALSYAQVLL